MVISSYLILEKVIYVIAEGFFLFLGEEIYRNLFIKSTCKDGSSSCLKYYKTQSKYKLKVSVICIS